MIAVLVGVGLAFLWPKSPRLLGKPLAHWVRQAGAADTAVGRCDALRVLEDAPEPYTDALLALAGALRDPEREVQQEALRVLEVWRVRLADEHADAAARRAAESRVAPELVAIVADANLPEEDREAAARSLLVLGKTAVPAVKAAVADSSLPAQARQTLNGALMLLGIANRDAGAVNEAAQATQAPEVRIGRSLAECVEGVRSATDAAEIRRCAAGLSAYAESDPKTAEPLIELADGADPQRRTMAIELLSRCAIAVRKGRYSLPDATRSEIQARLIRVLADGDSEARGAAVRALQGGDAAACAALATGLADPHPQFRFDCGLALVRTGGAAVPAVIEALRHPEAEARIEAVKVLGMFGSGAREAAPALEELSRRDPDGRVQREARIALQEVRS